ncbi:hypothetical protein [Microbispora hainanensis]|uniref:Uncharacterized protein n=1 Tax=Microbispora hainanensis TaxID=568844 RepID=A0A544Z1L0_9ACTN|nr:hypothetical protein [Microbispora hainanensis]TQS22898.1 hypothetical protein FLX08_06035 [Microbispora hainanensis]
MGEWRRFSLLAATVVAAATAVGCGADAGPSAEPPPGVSVSLQQNRSDVPAHKMQVAVRNDTATPVYFKDVRLLTDSFQETPPQPVDTVLGRTPRTDFPISYGAARCAPTRIPDAEPATVVAHIAVGKGPLHEVRWRIPHPDPLLRQLVNIECGEFLLRRSIDVTFGPAWTRSGRQLRGALRVDLKAGAGQVTIEDIAGTTHYDLRPASGEPKPVAVLTGTRDLPVVVTPSRCDRHAMGEAKQAYLFSLWASAGGTQTYRLIVVPDQRTQRLFESYAMEVCAERR